MTYCVAIRCNATGEVRVVPMGDWCHWEDHHLFNWQDNNYSCDCNRELFFRRPVGEVVGIDDVECSTGRFAALYAELEDGTRITIDEPNS